MFLHLSGSLRQAKVKIYPVFNPPPDLADSSSCLLTLTESLIYPKSSLCPPLWSLSAVDCTERHIDRDKKHSCFVGIDSLLTPRVTIRGTAVSLYFCLSGTKW